MVFDSSAILALIHRETGADIVGQALPNAVASAVNIAEVVTRLSDRSMPDEGIRKTIDSLRLRVVPFDGGQAYKAGALRRATRHAGLSLGDRACLALAAALGLPALTADRAWAELDIGVEIQLIR